MKADDIPVIIYEIEKNMADTNIGFGNIADMVRERSKADGFYLNLMVLSRRGSGTSALINTIFNCEVLEKSRTDDITVFRNTITENDLNLNLTVTICHHQNTDLIIDFIEGNYHDYFVNEVYRNHPSMDKRVHACLWLVPGDAIRPEELEMIQKVSKIVNFIPVINKADSFTQKELEETKLRLRDFFSSNDVNVFYPTTVDTEDNEYENETKKIVESYPLSVFSATDTIEIAGIKRRGREYPWGFIDCEDDTLNDLNKLRSLLVRNHLEDLARNTDVRFYNEYRSRMAQIENIDETIKKKRFKTLIQEMTRIHEAKHRARLEILDSEIAEFERSLESKE